MPCLLYDLRNETHAYNRTIMKKILQTEYEILDFHLFEVNLCIFYLFYLYVFKNKKCMYPYVIVSKV